MSPPRDQHAFGEALGSLDGGNDSSLVSRNELISNIIQVIAYDLRLRTDS
jgi:hypothetical protein